LLTSLSRAGWLVALAAALVMVVSVPVVATAIHNRVAFGTFYTTGPPPRVDWCGRRYYPAMSEKSLSGVQAFLAENGQHGLTRIGSVPSGSPIVANVTTPAERAAYHTNICTMEVFVQTGPDRSLPYGLSGGP
jgi:hypothetical protein